jgi:AcrR family transcriptional regulator
VVTTPEPLRQRRKRELRQQLSDVATGMFLEHGFDAVRVADVARACGVTEATVFNHFPSKESLLVDRWDGIIETMRAKVADPGAAPLAATLEVLEAELAFVTSSASDADPDSGVELTRRFRDLVASTPALVAHERAALDRLTATIAAALADRTGASHEDPASWITAAALTGLWTVLYRSLHHHLPTGDAAGIRQAVRQDVAIAAETLRQGL